MRRRHLRTHYGEEYYSEQATGCRQRDYEIGITSLSYDENFSQRKSFGQPVSRWQTVTYVNRQHSRNAERECCSKELWSRKRHKVIGIEREYKNATSAEQEGEVCHHGYDRFENVEPSITRTCDADRNRHGKHDH